MSENKEEYRRFIQNRMDIPVFFQDWWLEAVSEGQTWDIFLLKDKEDQIRLILPYIITSKFGFQMCKQPKLTPFLGAKLFYPKPELKQAKRLSFENEFLGQLSRQLQQKDILYFNQLFSPKMTNWKPLFWSGFLQTTYYRSVLHGISDLKTTHHGFKYNKKYEINKFAKSGGLIEESEDAGKMYDLILSSYQNDKNSIPFSKELYLRLNAAISAKGHRKIFQAKDRSGNVIAALFLVIDFDRAYLINTGMDYRFKDSTAKSALIWHAIQYASKYVDTFDFCGSMIPSISDFFQGFGGIEEPYSRIFRYQNKLVKSIFTLMGR